MTALKVALWRRFQAQPTRQYSVLPDASHARSTQDICFVSEPGKAKRANQALMAPGE